MISRWLDRRKHVDTSIKAAASTSTSPATRPARCSAVRNVGDRTYAPVRPEVVLDHVRGQRVPQFDVGLGGHDDGQSLIKKVLDRVSDRIQHIARIGGVETTVVQRLQRAESFGENRLEKAGPVAIVVEDARLGDPGPGRHFARREAGHTLLAQELERGGQDRLSAAGRRTAATLGNRGSHVPPP